MIGLLIEPAIRKTVEHIAHHPYRTLSGLGAIGLIGAAGIGGWQGKFETSVAVEKKIVVEDQGYGEVTEVTLKIPEHPMVGYVADVTDAKTVLSKEIKGKIFGIKMPTIPAGTNWVTVDETVPTVISHNPNSITAAYDPGLIKDEDDDRLIFTVPLDTFSIENHIEPDGEKFDFHGNWMNLGGNFATAFARSFDGLKNLPGIGTLDQGNNETENTLLGVTRVNILNNVAESCTPKVTSNTVVYKALHENIANLAPLAIRDSTDPTIQKLKDTKTASQVEDIKVVVYIGAENDEQPFLPNQVLDFQNPYTEKIEEYKNNKDIKLESSGDFECELSDEVREILKDADVETTSAPSTEAKDD